MKLDIEAELKRACPCPRPQCLAAKEALTRLRDREEKLKRIWVLALEQQTQSTEQRKAAFFEILRLCGGE